MSSSKTEPNPIDELLKVSLNEDEFAFVFYGWAGILLKAKQKILAFDLCQYVLKNRNVNKITLLDLQLNSHIHGDHFDKNSTTQLYNQTGAKIIVDPQIAEELKGEVPDDAVFSGHPDTPLHIDDFTVHAIAGIHPSPITIFHVEWNDLSVFHGADSDYVPLHDYKAKLAFIPTGSPSPSCSPEKGLKMALDVTPDVAIAMHGNQSQMNKFKTLVAKELPETRVLLPTKGVFNKITF